MVEVERNQGHRHLFRRPRENIEEVPGTQKGLLHKVLIPMVTSPLLGFFGGFIVMALLYLLPQRWRPVTVTRVSAAATGLVRLYGVKPRHE